MWRCGSDNMQRLCWETVLDCDLTFSGIRVKPIEAARTRSAATVSEQRRCSHLSAVWFFMKLLIKRMKIPA